jgi:hypothetical protein
MGYDLISLKDDSRFCVNSSGWGPLLKLAEQYGWIAEGTDPSIYGSNASERAAIKEKDPNYDAGYFTNDGQIVKGTDAIKIADALEKALNDISDDEDSKIKYHTFKLPSRAGKESATIKVESSESLLKRQSNPLTYFSGINNKSWIKDFVKFCRIDAFTIE